MKKKDIVDAGRKVTLEGVVKDGIPALINYMFHGTSLELFGGLLSTITPRIGGIILAYQQKRADDNFLAFMDECSKQQDDINKRIDALEDQKKKEIKDMYFPLVVDYAIKARQQDKIRYIVSGFKNLPEQGDFKEDFVLLYYDILDELNLLDIRVLKLCVPGGIKGDNIMRVMTDYNIQQDQVKHIVDKLYRKGLLQDKSEDIITENFKRIADYITKQEHENILEIINMKEIRALEQSDFGKNFINFFEIE